MNLLAETLPYIEGKKFADLIPFKIQQRGKLQDRMDFVESLIQGKSVLHVGCLDHLPLIEQKIKDNRWFHGRISQSASTCLGVDINLEGIEFVRSNLGINNICYGKIDSSEKIPEIANSYWDYVVLGEVLEHIDNPVDFLNKFLNTYRSCFEKIILTVPNAFRIGNFLAAMKSQELINSDHRYWFSPYTAWKVAHQAGFQIDAIQMCKFSVDCGSKAILKNWILKNILYLQKMS
jgi:Methyltransferase domain